MIGGCEKFNRKFEVLTQIIAVGLQTFCSILTCYENNTAERKVQSVSPTEKNCCADLHISHKKKKNNKQT